MRQAGQDTMGGKGTTERKGMTEETVEEPASAESKVVVLSVADAGLCGP